MINSPNCILNCADILRHLALTVGNMRVVFGSDFAIVVHFLRSYRAMLYLD